MTPNDPTPAAGLIFIEIAWKINVRQYSNNKKNGHDHRSMKGSSVLSLLK